MRARPSCALQRAAARPPVRDTAKAAIAPTASAIAPRIQNMRLCRKSPVIT